MNKEYITYNLKEALEQVNETLDEIKNDPDYDNGDYVADMTHLYHHINTAWNAQNSTKKESRKCSEQNFYKWRQFPNDIYMGR